jgi:hypothetical protein
LPEGKQESASAVEQQESSVQQNNRLALGTKIMRSNIKVPDWKGQGVGGGWDCISNGDCTFLGGGAERGW